MRMSLIQPGTEYWVDIPGGRESGFSQFTGRARCVKTEFRYRPVIEGYPHYDKPLTNTQFVQQRNGGMFFRKVNEDGSVVMGREGVVCPTPRQVKTTWQERLDELAFVKQQKAARDEAEREDNQRREEKADSIRTALSLAGLYPRVSGGSPETGPLVVFSGDALDALVGTIRRLNLIDAGGC
jgi:hypothetical protein